MSNCLFGGKKVNFLKKEKFCEQLWKPSMTGTHEIDF